MLVASTVIVYRLGWSEIRPVAQPWISSAPAVAPLAAVDATVRIPLQLIASGKSPEWIYVEVGNQAVPEPGVFSLLALTSLLMVFRRQRA